MTQPDLEYNDDGLWTRFVPVTKEGGDAWNEMAKDDGVGAVLTIHKKSVLSQLRKAGYSVRKAKPVTKAEMETIMEELGI